MVETNGPDPEPTGDSGSDQSRPPSDIGEDPDFWAVEDPKDREPGDEPTEEEAYRLADEVTASGKSASEAADWYYIAGDQPQRGPVGLGDLQRMVAAGELDDDDRVWRSGLSEWTAVADVPELFDEAGPPPPPKPRPTVAARDRDDDRPPDPIEGLRSIERNMTEPAVLRSVGWACGAIGAMAGVISVPMLFFGRSWFVGATVLLLGFFVLHGLARLIEDRRA